MGICFSYRPTPGIGPLGGWCSAGIRPKSKKTPDLSSSGRELPESGVLFHFGRKIKKFSNKN